MAILLYLVPLPPYSRLYTGVVHNFINKNRADNTKVNTYKLDCPDGM